MLTWCAASVAYCHEYPNRRHRRRRRRPPGKAQRRRAGVCARHPGVAARDQHHRRGARRRLAGRRSLARHAADFDRRRRLAAHGAGHVVVHGALRSSRRVLGRGARRRGRRGALCARAVHRQLRAVHGGIRAARRLSSGARVLPVRRSRYGIRVLQAEGDLMGVGRRAVERLARPRDRARDVGDGIGRAVCRRLSRDDRAQRHRRGGPLVSRHSDRARRARQGGATRAGRSPSSRASPCSSSRCCRRWSASPR